MNRIARNIFIFLIMAIAISQSLFIYNCSNKTKVQTTYINKVNYRSLSEFNNELALLSNKEIISAKEENNKWFITLKLTGDKESILEDLYKLKKYKINDYVINYNSNEVTIRIEITDKEVV